MLCIECGKREAKYEGLCEECFLKKVKFTDLPKHMEIVRCPHCGAVKFKGEWKRMGEEEIIRELIERNMDILHDCGSISFDFNVREDNDSMLVDVVFRIKYEDLDVEEEHISEVGVRYESCPRCNRYFGNYFEAILQIRGVREGELHDIVNFAHERLAFYSEKNENLFVTKEEGKHGGWDIYISDKREAKKVADEICRKYGATLKSSPHIVGRKDGRDVYRMTYSVRLPEYREGDVIEMQSKYYSVEHVSGHYVKLISLDDGKEKSVDVRKHDIRVVKKKDELEEAMVIFSQGNEVQVMDGDYRTIEARSCREFKSGEKVKIIRTEDIVYVVP